MSGIGDFFGESKVIEQFLIWNVLSQVVQAAGQPYLQELTNLVNEATPLTPLDPATLAGQVARGITGQDYADKQSRQSGIDSGDFAHLVEQALRAPDLSMVMELLRRGKIGAGANDPADVSVNGALTDAGLRPEWHALVAQLAISIPTQAEVLNAWLEGQIDEGEARDRLVKAGMDPTWIQTAYNANGQAPTPVQALELLNRGIISERGTGPESTSYQQAFLEGPWRNKWLAAFLALRFYIPPPRTVTAMHKEGSLSTEQATKYLMDSGITADLAQAYLASSHHTAVAHDKLLAKGDIVTGYVDKLLTRDRAKAALVALKYQPHDADFILDLADVRRTTSNVNAVVSRTRALFTAGKMTRAEALATLTRLKLGTTEATELVDLWELEHHKTVKVLTPAQITHAELLGLITVDECDAELAAHGYSRFDSWVLRSIAHKDPQKNKPAYGT